MSEFGRQLHRGLADQSKTSLGAEGKTSPRHADRSLWKCTMNLIRREQFPATLVKKTKTVVLKVE